MNLLTENIWKIIQNSVSRTKPNLVAVAYFGEGGAELLPLKKDDLLVVDASIHQVRAGLVDPRELLKLIKIGVKVYSYPQLHAKVYALGESLFVGSSNVSENSNKNLQEAVVQTNDLKLVKQGIEWIESLAFSQLTEEDLKELKKEYKPPKTVTRTTLLVKSLYLVNVDFNSSFSKGHKEPLKKGKEEVEALVPDISKKDYDFFEYNPHPEFEIGDYLLIRSHSPKGDDMVNKPCRVLHIQPWGFNEKYFVFYSKPKGKRKQLEKLEFKLRKTDGFLTHKLTEEIMNYWKLNFNAL